MPNLGGDIPQRPAPAPNQTMAIEAQKHGKVDIKRPFTRPALLDSPTPLQYPVQDCLRKQIFDLNSAQSPSNSNFSTFCISSNHFSNAYGKHKTGQLR